MGGTKVPFLLLFLLKSFNSYCSCWVQQGPQGHCGQNPKRGRGGAGRKELGRRGEKITVHLCLAAVHRVFTEAGRTLTARNRAAQHCLWAPVSPFML
jgi:hypothetical protein